MTGGILAIWTDIAPELEADFNEWYWREHFPERLSIPGFLSAQRYRAIAGAPRYLAWYELESVEVLVSAAYQACLHHPTEWTTRVTAGFRNYTRAAFRRSLCFGDATGAFVLALRISRAANAPLPDVLRGYSTAPGVTRVQLWEAAEIEAPIPRELAALDKTDKGVTPVVTVETVDADVLRETTEHINRVGTAVAAAYQFLCSQHACSTPSPRA